MGDDLDDLLDEFENKFSPEKPIQNTIENKAVANTTSGSYLDTASELELAIKDICNSGGEEEAKSTAARHHLSPPSRSSSKKMKFHDPTRCNPLLLGGSTLAMGHSTRDTQKACSKLRCTSCDFHVIYFDNYVWHSRCDYLFFRNNVPDFQKLKKNLVNKKGCRAYACQCQWEGIDGVVELASLQKLKWVCGKHPLQ